MYNTVANTSHRIIRISGYFKIDCVLCGMRPKSYKVLVGPRDNCEKNVFQIGCRWCKTISGKVIIGDYYVSIEEIPFCNSSLRIDGLVVYTH
jgi:hypothetical protein